MEFTLEINMDNAAFDDSQELPRILRDLAKRIAANPEVGGYSVRDSNGNNVGHARYIGKRAGE